MFSRSNFFIVASFLTISQVNAVDYSLTWDRRFDGPEGLGDFAVKVAVDNDGNAYVVGYSDFVATSRDILVLKYSPSGSLEWSKAWSGIGAVNGKETPTSSTIDPWGNLIVCGLAPNGTSYDAVLLKIRPNGDTAWATWQDRMGNTSNSAIDVQVDGNGNSFVAENGSGTIHLIKVDSAGVVSFNKSLSLADGRTCEAHRVVLDQNGNATIAGYYAFGTHEFGMFLAHFDQNGDTTWTAFQKLGTATTLGSAGLAITSDGEYYLAGSGASGDPPASSSGKIYKYSSGGTQLWSHNYGGSGFMSYWELRGITAIPGGGVVATGSRNQINLCWWSTVCFAQNGDSLWEHRYPNIYPSNGNENPGSIVSDASGNVFITGGTMNNGPDQRLAVVHYTPDGLFSWTNVLSESSAHSDLGVSVALIPSGGFYVAGNLNRTSKDIVLRRYDRCCIGLTGNVDCSTDGNTDIADLSSLIDYLYLSMAPACCMEAANTDGQTGIDISDLTGLIDRLYLTFSPLAPCP